MIYELCKLPRPDWPGQSAAESPLPRAHWSAARMTHQYLINIHGWEYLVLIGQVGLLQNLLCLVLTGRQFVLWSLHDDALHNRLLLSRGRYATANHLVMHPFKLHATTVIQTFNKLNDDWKINGEEQQQQQPQQQQPLMVIIQVSRHVSRLRHGGFYWDKLTDRMHLLMPTSTSAFVIFIMEKMLQLSSMVLYTLSPYW